MKESLSILSEDTEPVAACPGEDTAQFIAGFRQKVRGQHIPLSGTFTLTHRCNFRCPHCYLGGKLEQADPSREQPLPVIAGILDQAAEAGCLTLLLTGGEPLLRPDFADIYRYAARKGMLLTVFTNGSLLTADIVALFRSYPPRAVEITLYGASEETYRRVTGRRGMHERVLRGIRQLKEAGVRFRLKAMLMKDTELDLPALEHFAAELNAPFRFDAALSPTLDGGSDPLASRLAPERVAEHEVSSQAQSALWARTMNALPDVAGEDDRLYTCGAGRTGFHLDPRGRLSPCLMIPWLTFDLATIPFTRAWQEIGKAMDGMKAPPDFPCRPCRYKNVCGYCPAFFRLETGSEQIRSDYLCALGQCRLDKSKPTRETCTHG
ncbi:MAG: radical SAM protein [Verrucomicrobia bacterium]|nr:radical SAM protein [Verrucomicrobiota bacterium]